MREIKFKVWDINKKVFIPNDVYAIITTDFKAFGVMLKDWEDYKEGEYMYPEYQTVIEYTGLKDKAGKEIYESDIDQDGGRIFYNESIAAFQIDYGGDVDIADMEDVDKWMVVSGNIYESPELLNPLK